MSWFRRLVNWVRGWWAKPAWRTTVLSGDELPHILPEDTLVVMIDDGEPWSAGMVCPCGCGRTLEVMLLEEVRPRWDVRVDAAGRPTLHPSVWAADGCRSHFWLRDGRIHWC